MMGREFFNLIFIQFRKKNLEWPNFEIKIMT